ncbi:hypothetical protein EXIGLDRAFT_838119 [Exidia glandulosa HHB12029]|uniref:Uncharacterized protein n=1 Tax=Exidia glandulosa HHB12029 TaxID=1314781 RepID=A0A165G5I6_EXIGL|nr:hypothetical protein EXIGLDRAFT_838119 [Exidia glandulosa HHB12029]
MNGSTLASTRGAEIDVDREIGRYAGFRSFTHHLTELFSSSRMPNHVHADLLRRGTATTGCKALQPISHLLEPRLRSPQKSIAQFISITFVNRRSHGCVILYALDCAGRRVQRATLNAGEKSILPTLLAEPWVAVERGTGDLNMDKPLGIWIARDDGAVAWID